VGLVPKRVETIVTPGAAGRGGLGGKGANRGDLNDLSADGWPGERGRSYDVAELSAPE
jgi:hypothetical protein